MRTRLPAVLAICLVGAAALASPPQSSLTLVSLRDGTVSQVATSPPLHLHDAFGVKGLTVEAKAFAGLAFDAGKLTGGLTLGKTFPFSREVAADVGVYGRWVAGRPADAGLYAGFVFRI